MTELLPMAIDCRNLTYRYGQFTAVDDLTLKVRPGETLGLLGTQRRRKDNPGADADHPDPGPAG